MKNACIVFKREKNFFSEWKYNTVLDSFFSLGYAFEEIRVLFGTEESKLRSILLELKKDYDNILFLTNTAMLSTARSLLSTLFKEENIGMASGAGIFSENGKSLFLLPEDSSETVGECIPNVCVPFLLKKYGTRLDKIVIRTIGASEMRVKSLLAQARNLYRGTLTYSHTRHNDEDIIRIFYDQNVPKMLTDDVLRLFAEGLGDTVYALDDTSLEKQLVQLLKLRGRKISVAESFTGGGIARRITSVSGASEVYFEGLNTYNENAKIKRLGVSEYTLGTVGAVSDQTAYEMATGLLATGDCDICIATTGIAGPKSDKSMLPVGLCYIAVGTKERVFVYRYKFDGTREDITETAINYALHLAYKQLKNM